MFLLYLYLTFSKSFIEILNVIYFNSKAQGISMPAFFLPNMSVFFPVIPLSRGPISYQDLYLNSTLAFQISLIACLKTREMWYF